MLGLRSTQKNGFGEVKHGERYTWCRRLRFERKLDFPHIKNKKNLTKLSCMETVIKMILSLSSLFLILVAF